ncbi:MAG: four helix bundle protein [Candidatus Taylorbacteria bacterium]
MIHTHTPARLLPVLQKVKDSYILWHSYCSDLPKTERHSFGYRIDSLFIEIIEAIAAASFLSPQEKSPYVRLAIRKLDTLKILLMILWESKSLDNKKYIALSIKLDEIGRNLGGWNGQLIKQNSPTKAGEK